ERATNRREMFLDPQKANALAVQLARGGPVFCEPRDIGPNGSRQEDPVSEADRLGNEHRLFRQCAGASRVVLAQGEPSQEPERQSRGVSIADKTADRYCLFQATPRGLGLIRPNQGTKQLERAWQLDLIRRLPGERHRLLNHSAR